MITQTIHSIQISEPDANGSRLILGLGSRPGCASGFQPVYYRVWRIGKGDPQLLLDESKFAKECYFDYTSPVTLSASLYVDGSIIPYFTFALPPNPNRAVIRVRFSNNNSGTTAFSFRTWRITIITTSTQNPLQSFQLWAKPKIMWKPIGGGNNYRPYELEV